MPPASRAASIFSQTEDSLRDILEQERLDFRKQNGVPCMPIEAYFQKPNGWFMVQCPLPSHAKDHPHSKLLPSSPSHSVRASTVPPNSSQRGACIGKEQILRFATSTGSRLVCTLGSVAIPSDIVIQDPVLTHCILESSHLAPVLPTS